MRNPDILVHILPLLKEQDCVQMAATITIYDYLLAVGVQQQGGKSKAKDLTASMYKKEIFLILFSLFQSENATASRASAGILHALGEINIKKMIMILQDVKMQFTDCVNTLLRNEEFMDITQHIVELVSLIRKNSGGPGLLENVEDISLM